MRELKVSKNEAGQRLDKLLHKYLREAGDGFIYKMLRKKNIVLNDKKATGKEMLQSGDTVKLYFSEDTFEKMGAGVTEESAPFGCKLPKDFEKWIVFQDDALLILNKPAGVLSQSDDREKLSINEYCLQYLFEKGEVTEETLRTFKPGICNRLDRNTSGLILFGKTLPALQTMASILRDRSLEKYYLTVVQGTILKSEQIDGFLKKNEKDNHVSIRTTAFPGAVEIHTAYEPIAWGDLDAECEHAVKGHQDERDSLYDKRSGLNDARPNHVTSDFAWTLLRVHLITGKTHQIRAHLRSIGHPIYGDPKYGDLRLNSMLEKRYGIARQLLHAYEVKFPEGLDLTVSGKSIQALPPADFNLFIGSTLML